MSRMTACPPSHHWMNHPETVLSVWVSKRLMLKKSVVIGWLVGHHTYKRRLLIIGHCRRGDRRNVISQMKMMTLMTSCHQPVQTNVSAEWSSWRMNSWICVVSGRTATTSLIIWITLSDMLASTYHTLKSKWMRTRKVLYTVVCRTVIVASDSTWQYHFSCYYFAYIRFSSLIKYFKLICFVNIWENVKDKMDINYFRDSVWCGLGFLPGKAAWFSNCYLCKNIYLLLAVEFFSVTILPLIIFGTGVFIDLLHIQAGTVVYPGLPFPSSLPIFFTLKV